MKKKVVVIAIAFSLLLIGIFAAFGTDVSLIIGFIALLTMVLIGITVFLTGGEESEFRSEEDKLGVKHHSETRSTALGCYGPEAEEEKFAHYEEPPPQKKQQR